MHVGNSRITIWTCRAQRHENQGGSIDVVYEVLRSMIARVEVPRSILSILPLRSNSSRRHSTLAVLQFGLQTDVDHLGNRQTFLIPHSCSENLNSKWRPLKVLRVI